MSTLLVLDEDENTLTCLQEVLTAFGHLVLPTSSPEAALSVAQGVAFDLFLVDVQLPGLDPSSLISTLRRTSPNGLLMVVTNFPKDESTQAALAAGADGTMRKPFEIGEIIRLLPGGDH